MDQTKQEQDGNKVDKHGDREETITDNNNVLQNREEREVDEVKDMAKTLLLQVDIVNHADSSEECLTPN